MGKTGVQNLNIENQVFGKWISTIAVLDKFSVRTMEDIFRQLKYAAAQKLLFACGNDESLPSFDIRIYDSYMRILCAYKAIVNMHLNNEKLITSPIISNIWQGIYSILISRLMVNTEIKSDKQGIVNPLLLEKKNIVSRFVLELSKECELTFESYKEEKYYVHVQLLKENFVQDISFNSFEAYISKVFNMIVSSCTDRLYASYARNTQASLENLNNLFDRSDTSYYTKLLKEEQDILHQLVSVQINPLEQAIKSGNCSTRESLVLEDAIIILKETYQKESAEISRLDKLFNQGKQRAKENRGHINAELESISDFASSFDEIYPLYNELPASYEDLKSNFYKRYNIFEKFLKSLIENTISNKLDIVAKQNIYQFKKDISEQRFIAVELLACFNSIFNYYKENKDCLETCESLDILKGVAQTIEIKIESLTEALAPFEDDTQKLIDSFANDMQKLRNQELCEVLKGYLVKELLRLNIKEKKGAQFIKDILEKGIKNENLTNFNKNISDFWEKKSEILTKNLLTFKRDILFFELTTFEEILNYSVSRLRESLDINILEFVIEIDTQVKNLEDILLKHGVEKIVPQPKDPFNSREHEVLTVEQNEAFKKGEIIKTMNSGYRQKDTVIIRANVIAAK